MPRVISFLLLVAILALAGAVFFRVMAPFILPMFLAAVLVVVFKPLHMRVRGYLPARHKLAAIITTSLIMLTVLAPTVWIGWRAFRECSHVVSYLNKPENQQRIVAQLERRADGLAKKYEDVFDQKIDLAEVGRKYLGQASSLGASLLLSGASSVFKLLVGASIMMIALYYFLADGPYFLHSIMLLSPLEPEYEEELLNRFANVSRAVVSATLLSAVVQGLLAGVGYYFALNSGAPLFLLVAATTIMAVVPFVGAAGVWVPTCLWILLYQTVESGGKPVLDAQGAPIVGDTVSAVALAIYCAAVVSMIDNFIKPWVLHGQSNLHPLLALLSVLGGIAALGPAGLLIGPMIVAFVQALLVMVNKELALMGGEPALVGPPPATLAGSLNPLPPTASAASESAETAGPAAKSPSAVASSEKTTPLNKRAARGRKRR